MNPINTLQFRELFHIKLWGKIFYHVFLIVSIGILFSACKEDQPEEKVDPSGKIVFNFKHFLSDDPLFFDTLMYTNAAGNTYLVNEIQYFISDVTLFNTDGSEILIDDWKDIHYVDTDIPNSHRWEVYDKISIGIYDSINFTFGIADEKNISYMFVNPPESFMFWPEFLGGGYHSMKLNGKWLEEGQQTQTTPFDFHLGRGQIYHSYPDSITGFIPNDFKVSLPGSNFIMSSNNVMEFDVVMHVENWFKDTHIYDHDVWGGYIMQNQDAMQMVKENGWNVFSIEIKE